MAARSEIARAWFRPWGWTYRPAAWQGAVLVLLSTALCVAVFVVVDRRSHSVSDTLYGFVPYLVAAVVALHWVASRMGGGTG